MNCSMSATRVSGTSSWQKCPAFGSRTIGRPGHTPSKSAIAAANSAYDSVSKAAKQVAEIAEANVAAATNATVKAVAAAPKAGSSKKVA